MENNRTNSQHQGDPKKPDQSRDYRKTNDQNAQNQPHQNRDKYQEFSSRNQRDDKSRDSRQNNHQRDSKQDRDKEYGKTYSKNYEDKNEVKDLNSSSLQFKRHNTTGDYQSGKHEPIRENQRESKHQARKSTSRPSYKHYDQHHQPQYKYDDSRSQRHCGTDRTDKYSDYRSHRDEGQRANYKGLYSEFQQNLFIERESSRNYRTRDRNMENYHQNTDYQRSHGSYQDRQLFNREYNRKDLKNKQDHNNHHYNTVSKHDYQRNDNRHYDRRESYDLNRKSRSRVYQQRDRHDYHDNRYDRDYRKTQKYSHHNNYRDHNYGRDFYQRDSRKHDQMGYYSHRHNRPYYQNNHYRSGRDSYHRHHQTDNYRRHYNKHEAENFQRRDSDKKRQQKHREQEEEDDYDESGSRSARTDSNSSGGTIRSGVRKNGDAGHYKYKIGQLLGRYRIDEHLGDGTFGRALKCWHLDENKYYAVKIIRAVKRYVESAKIEADILKDIHEKGGTKFGIVHMKEYFFHKEKDVDHMCIVFETLGKSLYDCIKANSYKGFSLAQIQKIGRQALQALQFLHSHQITHTDLKPENVLFTSNESVTITDQRYWPINVLQKRIIYGSERCESEANDQMSEDQEEDFNARNTKVSDVGGLRISKWSKPVNTDVKLIDFGGATYEDDHHTTTINTRQYRAPEVILECCQWDMKSDIWSMACILAELYTGEMFYGTHENLEHLAMIEKQCGPFPFWMAEKSEPFKDVFDLNKSESDIQKRGYRLNKREVDKKGMRVKNLEEMRLLCEIISPDNDHQDHLSFRNLLECMFEQEPKKRPSATECLNHKFFSLEIFDETDIPKEKLSAKSQSDSTRLGSKSTEKTYGSYSTISTANYDKYSSQKQNSSYTQSTLKHSLKQFDSSSDYNHQKERESHIKNGSQNKNKYQ